jgi:transcriptional regulator with XRE-family HTH domain
METENGYRLLGGERRLTAIDTLIKDDAVSDWTEDTLIPCVVKDAEDVKLDLSPENKERYAIITSNREQRAYTDGDRYMEIQEWKKIIDELRSKGIEYINGVDEEGNEKKVGIKGEKTRDILAQATGMSRGQINNYETVHNSGTDKLKDALLQGKISVSTAAKAAKDLTDEEQDGIAEAVEKGEKVSPADIAAQAKKEYVLTQTEFKKDIKNILSAIKEKEITLDGQDQEKYHFHIRQLEKLIGGQK